MKNWSNLAKFANYFTSNTSYCTSNTFFASRIAYWGPPTHYLVSFCEGSSDEQWRTMTNKLKFWLYVAFLGFKGIVLLYTDSRRYYEVIPSIFQFIIIVFCIIISLILWYDYRDIARKVVEALFHSPFANGLSNRGYQLITFRGAVHTRWQHKTSILRHIFDPPTHLW